MPDQVIVFYAEGIACPTMLSRHVFPDLFAPPLRDVLPLPGVVAVR